MIGELLGSNSIQKKNDFIYKKEKMWSNLENVKESNKNKVCQRFLLKYFC